MWLEDILSNYSKYTAKKNTIMQFLFKNLSEEGLYLMPNAGLLSPDYYTEYEEAMKQNSGKPRAKIFHNKCMEYRST